MSLRQIIDRMLRMIGRQAKGTVSRDYSLVVLCVWIAMPYTLVQYTEKLLSSTGNGTEATHHLNFLSHFLALSLSF